MIVCEKHLDAKSEGEGGFQHERGGDAHLLAEEYKFRIFVSLWMPRENAIHMQHWLVKGVTQIGI